MITVSREGQYEISEDVEAKNVYIYKGKENTLKINRVYSTEWLCDYEMTNYPFDTQVFSSILYLSTSFVFTNKQMVLVSCDNVSVTVLSHGIHSNWNFKNFHETS